MVVVYAVRQVLCDYSTPIVCMCVCVYVVCVCVCVCVYVIFRTLEDLPM